MAIEVTGFFGFIPGIGAAFLSVYNFMKAQQGAVVQPDKFVTYGIWNISRGEEAKKMLFLPAVLNNIGIRPGVVSDIKFEFDGKEARLGRRVKLRENTESGAYNMSQQDFIDQIPVLPFYVPPKEGRIELFECYDDGDLIELDKEQTCKITVTYGFNKTNSVEFPFKLTSEDYKQGMILWIKP